MAVCANPLLLLYAFLIVSPQGKLSADFGRKCSGFIFCWKMALCLHICSISSIYIFHSLYISEYFCRPRTYLIFSRIIKKKKIKKRERRKSKHIVKKMPIKVHFCLTQAILIRCYSWLALQSLRLILQTHRDPLEILNNNTNYHVLMALFFSISHIPLHNTEFSIILNEEMEALSVKCHEFHRLWEQILESKAVLCSHPSGIQTNKIIEMLILFFVVLSLQSDYNNCYLTVLQWRQSKTIVVWSSPPRLFCPFCYWLLWVQVDWLWSFKWEWPQ